MESIILFIKDNYKVIFGILAGGTLLGAITFFKKKDSNKVNQKNNTVGGDMAGRDINKK